MKQQQLEDEVEDAVKKLAGDVDLFSEVDGEGQMPCPARRVTYT